MDFQQRMNNMGKGPLALAVVAALLSIGGIVTGLGPLADGETFGFTRVGLGLLGLAGSGLLMFGKDHGKTGWMVLMAWAVIQCVYYATEPDGNYTRQLIDGLLGVSSEKRVNDEITSYEAMGINIVGAAMAIWTYASRSRLALWKKIES